MTVEEIINELKKYNSKAEFNVIFDNMSYNINEIVYGSSEGVTKDTCEEVSIYINSTNDKYV